MNFCRSAKYGVVASSLRLFSTVITSYSIHYTTLYENRAIPLDERKPPEQALLAQPLGTVIYALRWPHERRRQPADGGRPARSAAARRAAEMSATGQGKQVTILVPNYKTPEIT